MDGSEVSEQFPLVAGRDIQNRDPVAIGDTQSAAVRGKCKSANAISVSATFSQGEMANHLGRARVPDDDALLSGARQPVAVEGQGDGLRGPTVEVVVGSGFRLSAIGIGIGLVAAFGLTRMMHAMLVGVSATDPATFGAIAILFLLIGVGSSWLPARRAAALEPSRALREE